MNDARAIELLTQAVQIRGHYQHICPESLTDLKEYVDKWGWDELDSSINGHELHCAWRRFVCSLGALLGPVKQQGVDHHV